MSSKATEQRFSIDKVAEVIGVHRATVARLMDSGELGYYQVGDRRIVGEGHLELYLSLAERKPKAKLSIERTTRARSSVYCSSQTQ